VSTRSIKWLTIVVPYLALLLAQFPGAAIAVGGQPVPPTPYLSSFHTYPDLPTAQRPTSLTLEGQWPYACGEIAEAILVDPGHIAIRIRQTPACPETTEVRWLWSRQFDLGLIDVGSHAVQVLLTVESDPAHGGATWVYADSLAVDVAVAPPPPGPGEHDSWMIRCLGGWRSSPLILTSHEPTTLTLWGWFPYFCGRVSDARVIGPCHVSLTLEPGPVCADTVQTWFQDFALGTLQPGRHAVMVDLNVMGDPDTSAARLRRTSFDIEVIDSIQPPPPPAPQVDSIPRLSWSEPNPFVTSTAFSVTLKDTRPSEVSIYDIAGRRVTLLHLGALGPGEHEFRWNGKRADGSIVPSGVYFYRLAVPGRVLTRRVVLIRGN
jgi:hypothetical protein